MLGIWNHPETGITPDIRKPYIAPQNDPRWTHAVTWLPGVTTDGPNWEDRADRRIVAANAALGPGRIPRTTPSVQENRLANHGTPLGYNWGFAYSLRPIFPYPRRASVLSTQEPGLQNNHGPAPAPTPVYEPSYLPPVCRIG